MIARDVREEEWAAADEVDRGEAERERRRAVRRDGALLALVALAAGLLAGVYPLTPGFSMHDTPLVVVAAAVIALVSVAVVPVAGRLGRRLSRGGADDVLIVTAALMSVGAASIHFAVAKSHFDEYTLFGVFFVLSGIAQLVWPIWLLLRRWSPLLVLGAIGNTLIVALWAVDRIWGLPIGLEHWDPETMGFGDGVTTGFEVVLVASALAYLRRRSRAPLRRTTAFALALGVTVLTALGLLSVLGVGSSFLTPTA